MCSTGWQSVVVATASDLPANDMEASWSDSKSITIATERDHVTNKMRACLLEWQLIATTPRSETDTSTN